MITVLLVLQAFITIALIGVVLIQRSEGGGLGLGTSQGMGSFMTGRGTANLLTRVTAVLATLFMVLSLVLALLYRHSGGGSAEAILNAPSPAGPARNAAPASPLAPLPPVPGESAPAAPVAAQKATSQAAPSKTAPPAKPAPSAPAPTKQ
ncbi:MAG TPA: preprotein translocase subunit SecG [Acidiphilium sp.]|jgi:preprotein translocase subunit SecG|uniref:preprotein translocase subunit SecG n=1 Tax=unclassified Acidiphilium TaxID=2617493 RepID=UPI000BDC86E6|nr:MULTISPECIES: preprotein translocase subunit SecG [unclassified Acidiphilium]OYV55893.1 MAG: preprotein translocase subunit SecG [Acidiphilium sp. 20-67-58]HQT61139.1 preprotein translocase subunit SecG [Acidiphilium sp.]HQU11186.1 preprotein translocase subunit SecG [Acidiphilium sp.]